MDIVAAPPLRSAPTGSGTRAMLQARDIPGHELGLAAYLAIAASSLLFFYSNNDTLANVAYIGVSALPVVALFVGPRLLGLANRRAWYLIATAQLGFFAADLLRTTDGAPGIASFPMSADVVHALAYPIMALGFFALIRGGRTIFDVLDVTLIGVAGALLLWVVQIDDFIHTSALGDTARLVLLAYPIGGVMLLAGGAYLLVAHHRRPNTSAWLLVGSLGLLLLADMNRYGQLLGGQRSSPLTDLAWMASYILFGLAVLVPSAKQLELGARSVAVPRQHFTPIAIASVAMIPLFAIAEQLLHGHTETPLVILASVVVAGILVARIHGLLRGELEAERRYAALLASASDAFSVIDDNGRVMYSSPASINVLGRPVADVRDLHRLIREAVHPEDRRAHVPALRRVMRATGSSITREVRARRADGELRWLRVTATNRADDPAIRGVVINYRDVSEERRNEEHAQRLARERGLIAATIRATDTRGTPEDVAQLIVSHVGSLHGVNSAGLFIFEADGLATPYGFCVGERSQAPLGRVPRRRTTYLREQAARGPWIQLWRSVAGHPYNGIFRELGVQAVAYAPVRDGDEVIGFLHISAADNAEQALSAALPALVEFADICAALIGPKVAERTSVTAGRMRIRSIIDSRAYRPVYQPVVDTETGMVVGFEALTRFDDGTPPQAVFATARTLDMANALEVATVREAIRQAVDLPATAWLSINVSPATLVNDSGLADALADCPRQLVVEITEHEPIDDYAALRDAIHRLGPRVRLSIDDAGAGFASMRHVVELRPAFVKLDRAVVHGIERDEARRALATGLRHFARTAGFWLIAEGIETDAERSTLERIDIHYLQGYLLGRPRPASEY